MAEAERSLPRSPTLGVAEPQASTERSRARREWRARIRNVLYPVGIVLGVLVIWEAGTRMLEVPAFLLPPPSAIAVSFIANAPQRSQASLIPAELTTAPKSRSKRSSATR